MYKIKTDLHIHTNLDPEDGHISGLLSPKELIDLARKFEFQCISITHHDKLFDDKKINEYAKSLGILLMLGVEKNIEGKHVLLYNFDDYNINTFTELREKKAKKNLIIAPHPYYLTKDCLKDELVKNIDCFDAIEFSHFYHRLFNPNKRAIKIAKENNLPLIGSSDMHYRLQFGVTYSYIEAEDFSTQGIIEGIKNKRDILVTRSLTLKEFFKILSSELIIEMWK